MGIPRILPMLVSWIDQKKSARTAPMRRAS
jgi:hypothetical protein